MSQTIDFLIYGPAYERVRRSLSAVGAQPIIVDEAGVMWRNDQTVSLDDIDLRAGWLSLDVLNSGTVRHFAGNLLKSPRLEWVQSGAASFHEPVFQKLIQKGVQLSTSDAASATIAEYVLHGVLDVFQRGPERRRAQLERRWARLPFRDIAESNWLIIGFGAIGQETARRAGALGARVTGVNRSGSPHPLAGEMISMSGLTEALPQADVIVLSLPLGPDTENLVNAHFLDAIKRDAVLVNIGRGGLVDEAALLAALDQGTPAFAILDVFGKEPLPPDSVWWSRPDVAITAHLAALSPLTEKRGDALFVSNLDRYLSGETPTRIVNPEIVAATGKLHRSVG